MTSVALATGIARGLRGAAVVALAATTWIGATFPGFFVLENGVVASIGRRPFVVVITYSPCRSHHALDLTDQVPEAEHA